MTSFSLNGLTGGGSGGSGGAVKLISTTTLDGSTTSLALPAGYRNYRIVLDRVEGSATAVLFRVGTSGAEDKTATNYASQWMRATSTTISGSRITAATGWNITNNGGLTSNLQHTFVITLLDPLSSTKITAMIGQAYDRHNGATTSNTALYSGYGTHHAAATAHTHFFFGTGTAINTSSDLTAFASGTVVYLYGEE